MISSKDIQKQIIISPDMGKQDFLDVLIFCNFNFIFNVIDFDESLILLSNLFLFYWFIV